MGRKKLSQPWSARAGRSDILIPDDDPLEGSFELFATRHPDVAKVESRVLTIARSGGAIPRGEYTFREAFCAGERCDCRRVMFIVYRRALDAGLFDLPEHVLTIGFGWEPLSFYVDWMHGDVEGAALARGPVIELNSPLCGYGRALLEAFEATSLSSPEYVARIARHYELFKAA